MPNWSLRPSVPWALGENRERIRILEASPGGGSSGGYDTVEDEGTPLTQRTTIDFQGSGVTAADSGGVTVVTIPGGGGSLASDKVTRTSGNLTTTSTSFVDATGMTLTITTGARRVMVVVNAVIKNSSAGTSISLDVAVDGTRQGGSEGMIDPYQPTSSASFDMNGSFTYITDVLTAASHTFKIQWKVSAGTGTLYASSVIPAILSVVELA